MREKPAGAGRAVHELRAFILSHDRPDLTPVTLAVLEREGHREGSEWRFRCPTPEHLDVHPSARWNEAKGVWHCDSCGAGGGYIDLARLLGVNLERPWWSNPRARSSCELARPRSTAPRPELAKACTAEPIAEHLEQRFWVAVERQLGNPLPRALQGRGFTAKDRATLAFVADGEDGLFPILSPAGRIVAVKRRWANPHGGNRYCYVVSGIGNPAWCSPCIDVADDILLIEGELNALAAWLALDGRLGVMGVAGVGGSLWLEPLRGRQVFVYADADEAGQAARARWAATALLAGARRVHLLAPLPRGLDFCDVAHEEGCEGLAGLLP